MDPNFRCDQAYINSRRARGIYRLGDERVRPMQCACCHKTIAVKRGDLRDLNDQPARLRCKPCVEREAIYADLVRAKGPVELERQQAD